MNINEFINVYAVVIPGHVIYHRFAICQRQLRVGDLVFAAIFALEVA